MRLARASINAPRWPTRFAPTRSSAFTPTAVPPDGRGFHVNYSNPPVNDAQSGAAVRLAQVMAGQLAASGLTPSTYRGTNGLYGRADLAGLNLAQYPSILIELGNMKNQQEAAAMAAPEGRAKYAAAVVQGINAYLAQR